MGIQHDVLKLGCARRWDLFDIVQCLVAVNHPRVGIAMRHGAEQVSRCGGKDRKTVYRIHMCMCMCVCVCVQRAYCTHRKKATRKNTATQKHRNTLRKVRKERAHLLSEDGVLPIQGRLAPKPMYGGTAPCHHSNGACVNDKGCGAANRTAKPHGAAQHSTAQHSTTATATIGTGTSTGTGTGTVTG